MKKELPELPELPDEGSWELQEGDQIVQLLKQIAAAARSAYPNDPRIPSWITVLRGLDGVTDLLLGAFRNGAYLDLLPILLEIFSDEEKQQIRGILLEWLSKEVGPEQKGAQIMAVSGLQFFPDDPEVERALILLLDKESEPFAREAVVNALGNIGGPAAVPVLIQHLQRTDEKRSVRWKSAEALGRIAEPSALPTLLYMAESEPDWYLRWSVMGSLEHYDDPKSRDALVKRLREDEDGMVKSWAIRSLAARGVMTDEVKALIVDALSHKNEAARFRAAEALAKEGFHDSKAVPKLVEILENDSHEHVKVQAARTLAALKDPSVVPKLEQVISTAKPEQTDLRRETAKALYQFAPERALPHLREDLNREDPQHQMQGLITVSQSRARELIPDILKFVGDQRVGIAPPRQGWSSVTLHQGAIETLKRLGDLELTGSESRAQIEAMLRQKGLLK
jgi:HEAT repeat protein